jgi:ESS family glutamate:Na+ symporter
MIQALSFLIAGLALGSAWLLHSRTAFLRRWFIPPALIAGVILFLLGPEMTKLTWNGVQLLPHNVISEEMRAFIRQWPPFLLGYLFAAIVLGLESGAGKTGFLRPVIQQNLFVWFLAFGQLAGAYAIYLIFFSHSVSPLIAHVLEIGWAGGPGSAAAMSVVMRDLGQPGIGDLGLFSATLGQVWGALSGIWIVNFLNRRSRVETPETADTRAPVMSESDVRITLTQPDSIAEAQVRRGRLRGAGRVFLLFLAPLAAVFLSMGLTTLLGMLADAWPDGKALKNIPLFSLALLCAFPVRAVLNRFGLMTRANAETIQNINGQVLDWIILAAMASIVPEAFISLMAPFTALCLYGALFCLAAFFFFGPRMLPPATWRELGLINYGFATGTTALGLMLLGLLHSKTREEARLIYGIAVPFNAPFVGGGIISLTLPQLTAAGAAGWILLALCAALLAFYFTCSGLNRRSV